MTPPAERRLLMGRVLGAHGVKGVLRVLSYAAVPEDIAAYGPLEDETGGRCFPLKVVGRARGALLVETPGVSDRDQASALRGTKLYVARSVLPAPSEGEYYWDDLVGLRVELSDGSAFGEVTAVHDYGAGASLEVTRPKAASVLVPFTDRAVPVVDIAGRRVVIDPPEGLMETPESEES
ncbi:MAG TPA: ribosome maturation factor RimM [Stellaceae bacterium]|nr:ribosome maturation factor RimM [Stellaceae bacterium]